MAQRTIGAVRAAGVAIIEKEGSKPIEPGALGWAGYSGILEKGPVGELIIAASKKKFEKVCGGRITDSLLPDCCFDYYNLAVGAGGIVLVRVTDGNELQAEKTLYSRKTTQTPMGTIKAANGGRWGGKADKLTGELAAAGDLLEITIDTKVVMQKDEWKGGYVELEEVASTQYPITGNTAAGVITVAADQTMKTDWGAGPSLRYYVVRENENKAVSFEIRDGEEKPTTEFGIFVYVDGNLANQWPNLSVDPASTRYWVAIINNDTNNFEIEVVDLWIGAPTANVRPANHYGEISAVTATVLTAVIHEFKPASVGDGDGTLAIGTLTDAMVAQIITLTFTSPTAFDAVSDKFGALGSGTVASLFTPDNKWSPSFTLTAGATAWETADVAVLTYKPFVADSLIDGFVYPDKVNAPREKYRIVDNNHNTITAAAGSDLTVSGAPTDQFMVVATLELEGGRDGVADLTDADYQNQAWDTGSSPFNQIVGKNLGLVKLATPGINATAVQKSGIAYADAVNQHYRIEIPSGTVTEEAADAYCNDTIGRSDFACVSFPSYGYIADPDGNGEGKRKLIPLTGAIHGVEARIAVDYDGYHKAGAGIEAVLPNVLELTTGETILNEEYLNPLGIGIIKKSKGNFVVWGDRTLHLDPNWKWKHQREQMCYYENVLRENFDWIIFAINDPDTEKLALASLIAYFLPEWRKRALRGKTMGEAAIIKIDEEINTDATRAAGDMLSEISLKLADTTERFKMTIGKQGIFESVG